MRKYLGVDGSASAAILESIPEAKGDPDSAPHDLDQDVSYEATLREEPQVQLVGFNMDSQLFTIPTMLVQEVIRTMEPSRLPMTPSYVSGIINLRGRVTPMIRLRDLLGSTPPPRGRPIASPSSAVARGFSLASRSTACEACIGSIRKIFNGMWKWNLASTATASPVCSS